MYTAEEIKNRIADTNMKAIEAICKELGMNLVDIITKHKTEAGFIAAAIKSIVMKEAEEDMKNESDLNALENQSPE
jgi:DNA modification methylase